MSRSVIWVGLLALASGCSTALETGYEPPRKVGVSPSERRAYYASPYTAEAIAAQQERNDSSFRRPGSYR